MPIVGLIPARGGSKGVPRKNIRLVNGKPLIAYTIEAAIDSNLLDQLIVSTDDHEIAECAIKYGANVPFMRPAELANDTSTDLSVMQHAAAWISNEPTSSDILVYLRPTTPLKTPEIIDNTINKLKFEKELTGVRSVTRSDGVFHPYWMFKEYNNSLQPFIDGITTDEYFQRQLLPPCFRLNGVCDALRITNLSTGSIYGNEVGCIEIEENIALDIDTENDFLYFEFLMEQANRRSNNAI